MSYMTFLCSLFTEVKNDGEWIHLFDGKTLKGWKVQSDDVKVKDGEIQILSVKKNLWLLNEHTFKNFELEADVHMPTDKYNSGIGFRCSPGEKKISGYQCEIAENLSGAIFAIGKGWVYPTKKEEFPKFYEKAQDCFKSNAWNHIKIKCEGQRIQIWVNGHQTADVTNNFFEEGQVALQHHGKGGVHRFKNVKLKKL